MAVAWSAPGGERVHFLVRVIPYLLAAPRGCAFALAGARVLGHFFFQYLFQLPP